MHEPSCFLHGLLSFFFLLVILLLPLTPSDLILIQQKSMVQEQVLPDKPTGNLWYGVKSVH